MPKRRGESLRLICGRLTFGRLEWVASDLITCVPTPAANYVTTAKERHLNPRYPSILVAYKCRPSMSAVLNRNKLVILWRQAVCHIWWPLRVTSRKSWERGWCTYSSVYRRQSWENESKTTLIVCTSNWEDIKFQRQFYILLLAAPVKLSFCGFCCAVSANGAVY